MLPVLALTSISEPTRAQCQTTVSGNVINATWTLASSPICVTGDLRIIGLTIEPGVQVLIDGDYRIDVLSSLWAAGTDVSPIVFTSTTLDWNGIHFQNSSSGSLMRHCVVENADSGGIEILNSLPFIENCTIQNNRNPIGGGGVRVDINAGNLRLLGCTITGNTSAISGGGLSCNADNGSAIVLHGCTVSGNTANPTSATGDYRGGGIYFNPTSGSLTVAECDISGNRVNSYRRGSSSVASYSYGGGLYASGGDVTIVASKFRSNVAYAYAYSHSSNNDRAHGYGGGVYYAGPGNVLDIRNSAFTCNTTPLSSGKHYHSKGCGLHVESGAASVTNCVFLKNGETTTRDTDALHNVGGIVDVRNSIFWKNNQLTMTPDSYGAQLLGSGTTTVQYCDVMGGYAGTGNTSGDPLFVDETCGSSDVHLVGSFSPCIDTGEPDPTQRYDDVCFPPSLGTARNDMGAYGGPQACSPAMPASATLRNTSNPPSLTASPVVIGGVFMAQVDLAGTTGHSFAYLAAYSSPLNVTLGSGYDLLVNILDPGGNVFGTRIALGPVASFSFNVPSNVLLCGLSIYAQAAHVGGGPPPALSNACDLIIGTY